MLVKRANDRECRQLFDERLRYDERERFERYKQKFRSTDVIRKNVQNQTGLTAAASIPLNAGTGLTSTTGNALAITCECFNGTAYTLSSVADSQSNSWSVFAAATSTLAGGTSKIAVAATAKTGVTTITMTMTGTPGSIVSVFVYEMTTPVPLDVTAFSVSNAATSTTPTLSGMTAKGGGIMIATCVSANGVSAVNSPFSFDGTHAANFVNSTALTSQSVVWTQGTTGGYCISAVSLVPLRRVDLSFDAQGAANQFRTVAIG